MRVRRWTGRLALGAGLTMTLAAAGCALLVPLPPETSVESRLAALPRDGLPLEHDVQIHWNAHQVPFIEAASDGDAAFALGLVHAHLRLGQMELMRRISQGRISEMLGPLTVDIDHSLRILDFGRAAVAIEAGLAPETRAWLQRFVEGVNHYLARTDALPHEFAVLGLEPEPWTLRDLVTVGRLAATDVNWFVWFRLWALRARPDWPALWARLVRGGGASMPSFADGDNLAALTDLLAGVSRSGSNTLVVAPARTANGGALIASDPHLGFVLPNLWLIAGLKSPSYHVVGLMLPGLPFFALGRNRHIAWGGTNMRAASSDLIDVADLAPAQVTTRRETVRVRWWFDSEIAVRDTAFGPVISDSPLLKGPDGEAVALRWVGHEASDEFSAMLRVNRAQNWREYRAAFRGYAVSGQNMLYADAAGNIGQLMAVRLPSRADGEIPPLVHAPGEGDAAWSAQVEVDRLPARFNPPQGFLVSANNRPSETAVAVGYFFSPDDRVRRITTLLSERNAIDMADLLAIQTDVFESSAAAINGAVLAALGRLGAETGLGAAARDVASAMRAWDGRYDAGSRGAVAYEAFLTHFIAGFYGPRFPDGELAGFTSVAKMGLFLPEDIAAAEPAALERALAEALEKAAPALARFENWGEMHRLALSHPLSRIPVLGRRYEFADLPAAGSRQTVMKTNHAPSDERHEAGYGSQARHVSDLSDPDENYFVLLGGQDGWLRSSTFIDQVSLWREGKYVRVPLRLEAVRATFPHRTVLSAEASGAGER